MNAIVPIGAVALLLYALVKRVNVFSAFTEGAAEALPLIKTILPNLAAMLAAITLFRQSGALDALAKLLSPVLTPLGFDAELIPLVLLRPFSGSAAMAITAELMGRFGPDSLIGRSASVLVGSTETVFYTLALYFGSVGIRKSRFAVPVALAATLTSVVTGLLFTRLFS